MINSDNHIATSVKGTIQGQQVPAALSASHFAVDERDTKQLVAYCAKVASVLDYYNPLGARDGTWDTLLLADPTVLTAIIARYSAAPAFNQLIGFRRSIQSYPGSPDNIQFAQKFFSLGFDVVTQVDQWYKLSGQNFSDAKITTLLKEEIEEQGSVLLKDFYYSYFTLTEEFPGFKNEVLQRFSTLDPVWAFQPFPDRSTPLPDRLSDIVAYATQAAQMLYTWLQQIITEAQTEFELSLTRKDIPAHIGLLLTFLGIFQYQQQAINRLTGRHLDFYFTDVLKSRKRAAVPDTTIVTMELLKTKELFLPAGTQFNAGLDQNKNQVVFKTQEDQLITSVQIAEYQTLTFPQSPNECIRLSEVKKYNDIGNTPWPLFGLQVHTGVVSVTDAVMGFAISCPDLFTSQSTRTMTLSLACTNLQPIAGELKDLFTMSLTGNSGWFEPSLDHVNLSESGQLSFCFSMKVSDPPVIAYAEKLHGKGFDTAWPVVQVKLTNAGALSYATLSALTFDSLTVTAQVLGVTNIIAENDSGKLNPALPFNPFNIQSAPYNLYVGSQEFFVKPLSTLTLNIIWDNLPKSFSQYYSAYNDYYNGNSGLSEIIENPVFVNQAFAVNIDVLDDGKWLPAVEKVSSGKYRDKFELFTDDNFQLRREKPIVDGGKKSITLCGERMQKSLMTLPHDPTLAPFTSFSSTLPAGFLRVTLCSPDKGFGCGDYPAVVSSVALYNSEALMHNACWVKLRKWKVKAMPNIPYTPRIKSIDLDYNSSETYSSGVSDQPVKYYHIHPSGMEAVDWSSTTSVLPVYPKSSYVYLGLDTLSPGSDVSLLFVLDNPVTSIDSKGDPQLDPEYLSTSGWRALDVLSDTTSAFQQTGVIRFIAADDIAAASMKNSSNCYWIRLAGDVHSRISISFVSTQAIALVRETNGEDNIVPIPVGTISKSLKPLAGVKSVLQPIASAGAQARQTAEDFHRTTALRLRDKGRITTIRSLESMLLDQFTALFKVTAIPGGYGNATNAGTTEVIVIPFVSPDAPNCYRPLASIGLMESVMKVLLQVGLPDVNYEVSNADFYEANVTCDVVFTPAEQGEQGIRRLNSDLCDFLSPWIKDGKPKVDATFNPAGQVYAFIKSLGYIVSISKFSFAVSPVSDGPLPATGLIVPALKHTINSTAVKRGVDQSEDGLRIGKNFFITH